MHVDRGYTMCPREQQQGKAVCDAHYRHNALSIYLSHSWLSVVESTEMEGQLCILIILLDYLWKNLESLTISN